MSKYNVTDYVIDGHKFTYPATSTVLKDYEDRQDEIKVRVATAKVQVSTPVKNTVEEGGESND